MSTNDYLKFLVQEMVKYMDTPREERREARMLRREQRMHWTYRLFGMVPFGMKMFAGQQKNRLKGGSR
ncbi:YqzE family protein [Kroppenstedtia eburnea]|uniref:YqzE-like protein n=1 Tax=Kroppenstedtia eburnea TaxID=714067 RepID=A0A1N7J798_9BACL|nr:YqzE family protein [Kroppenstedtia eburnea]QKI82575.1 YqzE family protein [Kroppenstedtia eburnea]SIS45233.1 YqzE-like protein [Kroppenstedtia eburnea]